MATNIIQNLLKIIKQIDKKFKNKFIIKILNTAENITNLNK